MRKSRIIWIVLSVVLVLALILGGAYFLLEKQRQEQAAARAEVAQRTAYEKYTGLLSNLEATRLTVTESGKTIGVYDLAQLGLLDQAQADARKTCGEWDRMDPDLFATLGAEEKITWQARSGRQEPIVTLDAQRLDVSSVLMDLSKEIRVAPKDAYLRFEGDAYAIVPEEPGTMLQNEIVARSLQTAVTGYTVTSGAPGQIAFEVADCGAYQLPAVTEATGSFDYAAQLERDTAGLTIPVSFRGSVQNLDAASLVSVDQSGAVQVDRAALEQKVAAWAPGCQAENAPYMLDSHEEGPIPLDFVRCTYVLDQAGLVDLLETQLKHLDAATVEAPFQCTRNGQPFSISGNYVEVDIENQKMIYVKDGEALVVTDVVTGAAWGYNTPTGLYAVENKDVNCWLSGPDYNVFVKYWVGFYGPYGIHDASWRTIFGGTQYLKEGSHGCVNTPEEAMAKIHADITVGVPVVVHDVKD